jgi:uncharacterized protein YjiS (DUF1127 family)
MQFKKRSSGAAAERMCRSDDGIFDIVDRRPQFRDEDSADAGDRSSHGDARAVAPGALAIFMPDGFRHLSDTAAWFAPDASPSPRSRPLAAAMSWVAMHILEGFALCAVAHSGFVWPPSEHPVPDNATQVSRLLLRPYADQPAMDGAIEADAVASLETVPTTLPSRGARAMALLAELWARARRRREIMRMRAGWQTLDDRTLKDIGLSRHEVDIFSGRNRRWD